MIHTDFETWLLDFHDEKFFTVYEKISEQWKVVSEYSIISEAIELPNQDVLIGFKTVWKLDDGDWESSETIFYEHLSKIKIVDVTEEFKR